MSHRLVESAIVSPPVRRHTVDLIVTGTNPVVIAFAGGN
jgi:hypothetical protein